MITEKGTVKTTVKHSEKLYSELNRNVRNVGIMCLVVGGLVVALGILLLGIDIYEGRYDTDSYIVIGLGAICLFLGIFYVIICKNAGKNALKMNRVQEVEFCDGYMMEWEYTDGELTSTNKVYYKWIVRFRETKNFLFLYNTRVTAVAVDKNGLPLNELNIIRSLLGRPTVVPTVQTPQSVSDAPPAEPFSDMTDNKEE